MGIEPTWDLVEPHAGFEDRERHQAALHLRAENVAHTDQTRGRGMRCSEPGVTTADS
jgi:hypothetical protein